VKDAQAAAQQLKGQLQEAAAAKADLEQQLDRTTAHLDATEVRGSRGSACCLPACCPLVLALALEPGLVCTDPAAAAGHESCTGRSDWCAWPAAVAVQSHSWPLHAQHLHLRMHVHTLRSTPQPLTNHDHTNPFSEADGLTGQS
jgi:hypothetical protein